MCFSRRKRHIFQWKRKGIEKKIDCGILKQLTYIYDSEI